MLGFGPEPIISATKDTEKTVLSWKKKVLRFGYTLKEKFNISGNGIIAVIPVVIWGLELE